MKSMILAMLAWCASIHLVAAENWRDAYSALLEKYVSEEGVDYGAWKGNQADVTELNQIMDHISRHGPGADTKEAKLAYYMNAYNAWVLKHVLDKYPITSVTDLGSGFELFSEKRIQVGGDKMSLNYLEKELLIKQLDEPRVHFGVNCAAKSCPPLASYAFTSDRVDLQLEQLSADFILKNPTGVKVSDNTVKLSKIFEWYSKDFEPEGVIFFVNRYRSKKIPKDIEFSYFKYDWALNKSK
ncbi:MAG: DUF547 domain-containing protein [Verrucomicrobiota bacterium]